MKKITYVIIVAVIAVYIFFFGRYLLNLIHEQANKSTSQGTAKESILLGSSAALTGHASFLGLEYVKGAQLYFNEINEKGGINGRKIVLISYDDQYDPAQTVINTGKFIEQDKVFALFNYVGTPTTVKVLPTIETTKIPIVGMFTGANALRDPVKRYVFNIRASYYQEEKAFIKGIVEELKMDRVAVMYQDDAYGWDGLEGANLALKDYGLKPVAIASYERGTLNVEDGLKTIQAANPQAVMMVGTYSPMAKLIKLAKASGFKPLFQSVSFVGPEMLSQELGSDGNGVIVTQVVPPPYEKNLLIGVDEYTTLLKKYYPDSRPTFGSLEGFINAKIVVEAFDRVGENLDREKFIEALESIKNYSLGIASPVNFSPTNHQGMQRIYLTYIKNNKFILFSDWQEFKTEYDAMSAIGN
jgi:ABC-type branched-subunit amino acid transport system substrate-binding protein